MTLRRALLFVLVAIPLLLGAFWWWTMQTTAGAHFVWDRVAGALGDRISVESIAGTIGSDLEITGFRYRSGGITVEVGRFSGAVGFDLRPFGITIAAATADEVTVAVRPSPSPGPKKTLEQRLQSLVLPVNLKVDSLAVNDIGISTGERRRPIRITQASLVGAWTDHVAIDRLALEYDGAKLAVSGTLGLADAGPLELRAKLSAGAGFVPRVTLLELEALIGGDLRRYDYRIEGAITTAETGPLAVAAEGSGDFAAVAIGRLRADGEALAGTADGEVAWRGGFRADLHLALDRLALDGFVAPWPAGHPVGGTLAFRFDAPQVEIHDADLAVVNSDARLGGSFSTNIETGAIDADLEWRALEWPIASTTPRLSSDDGQVTLSGTFDDWQAEGTLAVASPGLPPGRFTVTARGDRTGAAGEIAEGQVLGGSVSGTASADWGEALSFAADLDLADIRTSGLLPDWPGVVSGHVAASGRTEPLAFDLELEGVHGRLRGWPLSATGQVTLDSGGLTARRLVVRHGNSELRLDGGLDRPDGVRFVADVETLSTYLDGVEGDVRAEGRVARQNGEPTLEAVVASEELAFGETAFRDTRIEVEANRTFQAAELESRLDDQELRLAANGVFDDPDAPRAWHGTLTELSLAQPPAVDGEGTRREIFLVQSAPITLSSDSVILERACLQGSIEAHLCVAVDWMAGRRLEILAELDAIAVDRVNQFVATGFVFDQHVTGQMRWDKAAGEPLTAFADLEISPGTIRSRDDPAVGIQTGEGVITFDVRAGALLEGELRLPLPGTGSVEGTFSLADIADLRDSAIAGRLDAELSDMAAIRMFVPSVERADGRLSAKVSVDGTVQAPVLTGNVTLRDGALAYRPIGLELEDIELDAAFGEGRQFELTGSFLAGEGRGTVASSGVYGNGFREDLVVTLEGERLRLIDVPDLTAVADADVRVGFDDGIIRLDGEIVVPHARISPRNLLATRHSESADVVVVAGERETAPEDPVAREAPVLFDGKLVVGLGDDVIVDIDLAEAQVTGSVEFTWDRSLMPVANGRYEVSGDVQVYGQVLDITEGTIRFPNVPANNPYLRVRAEREIFGNSQIKSAGILVDGTLRRPTVEPYTEPRTTRERALTLLVTGSDFDMEQGVGAIDFGTYVAPRLFVSYGIGLFDQENVISARYDLGKGFGLKATSGQSESGIDLIYHVER